MDIISFKMYLSTKHYFMCNHIDYNYMFICICVFICAFTFRTQVGTYIIMSLNIIGGTRIIYNVTFQVFPTYLGVLGKYEFSSIATSVVINHDSSFIIRVPTIEVKPEFECLIKSGRIFCVKCSRALQCSEFVIRSIFRRFTKVQNIFSSGISLNLRLFLMRTLFCVVFLNLILSLISVLIKTNLPHMILLHISFAFQNHIWYSLQYWQPA